MYTDNPQIPNLKGILLMFMLDTFLCVEKDIIFSSSNYTQKFIVKKCFSYYTNLYTYKRNFYIKSNYKASQSKRLFIKFYLIDYSNS